MIVYKEMKQTKILSKKNISNIELSSNFWKYLPKTRARREIMLSRHMLKSSFAGENKWFQSQESLWRD